MKIQQAFKGEHPNEILNLVEIYDVIVEKEVALIALELC